MALAQESQGEIEALASRYGFELRYTGLGKIKAALATQKWIAELKPAWVLNLGTAGSRRFKTGEIVEAQKILQRDNTFKMLGQKIFETLPVTDLPKVICGTADFVEMAEPAVACEIFDMEAYAIAFVCDQWQVPFHCIKYVTDASDENVVTDWKKNLKAASQELKKICVSLFEQPQ